MKFRNGPLAPPSAWHRGAFSTALAGCFGLMASQPLQAQLDPQACYALADAGDELFIDTPTTDWTAIGDNGVTLIEAIAYNPYNGALYATNIDDFGSLSLTDGSFTSIGVPIGIARHPTLGDIEIGDLDGLTVDPYTQLVWASERRGAALVRDVLILIDPATGQLVPDTFGPGVDYVEIEEVVDTTTGNTNYDIDDLAMDPTTGVLYGVSNNGGGGGMLVTINTTDGTLDSVVGALPVNDIEGLGFYNDGFLYGTTGGSAGVDSNKMFLIDKTDASTTDLGLIDDTGLNGDFESVDCYTGAPNLITGTVFHDEDEDGVIDSGENGTPGVTVNLYLDVNGDGIIDPAVDQLIMTEETAPDGTYQFDIAATGDFIVVIDTGDLPPEHSMTTDNVETASFDGVGQVDADNDFGHDADGTIGNYVWIDEDGDGDQDAGESGIAGVTVNLRDDSGAIIATTTTDANGGYLFTELPPGDYTVEVDGSTVPSGLWPTYDEDSGTSAPDMTTEVALSAGEEHLSADFGYNYSPPADTNNPGKVPGAIGDTIWNDADGDGVQDPGESGIAGVTVELLTDDNGDGVYGGPGDNPPLTTTTGPDGTYIFDDLDPGAYVVQVDDSTLPAGFVTTPTGDPDGDGDNTAEPVVLGPGDVLLTQDFGYTYPTGNDIGDTIWLDADVDGTQDAGEPGIAGVTVALLDANGDVIATTETDSNGNYLFPGLPDGDYTVVVTDTDNVLGELGLVSDPDGGDDAQSDVTLSGADDLDQDFGYAPAGHDAGEGLIGDTVFIDYDGSGSPDPGEGVEGVVVELYDATGTVLLATTTTDENGNYSFGGLDPTGTYTVVVDPSTLPSGLTNSVDPDGGAPSTSVVDLSADPDGIDLDQDFGYVPSVPNSIEGTVWEDMDANGTLDESGTGLAGVTVELLDADGNVIATTVTDAAGDYSFDNLPDGVYTVNVTDSANVLNGMWHSDGPNDGADNNSQVEPYTIDLDSAGASAAPVVDTTADFGYYDDPASIGDTVFVDSDVDGLQDSGEPGIPGVPVTLTITYPSGDVVEVVTVTDANGNYEFPNLLLDEDYDGVGTPGVDEPVFVVTVGTPAGYVPTSSNQGGNDALDSDDGIAGETAEPTEGATDSTNDFGFVPQKPATYEAWQFVNSADLGTDDGDPGNDEDAPGDNPDGDIYPNALEHAFCMHPGNGAAGGFCVELDPDTGLVKASFLRPVGISDVTYTLQSASAPGSPTTWTDETLAPVIDSTSADIPAGAERVCYDDLESSIGASGLTRICVELDGATYYTQAYGWDTSDFLGGCQTYGYPYASKGDFSGTAADGDYSAGSLDVSSAGGDFAATLATGTEYYIEFIDGLYEGHRFDVDEAASSATAAVIDTASGHNTLDPVPADLQGQYEVRSHLTFDQLADPDLAVPTNDPATGDRILLFNGTSWDTFWVTDVSGFVSPQWTDVTDGSLVDAGSTVVDPCAGFFLHPKGGTMSVTKVGIVRDWDFACPLKAGSNLIGGGYPLDMSPADRAMNRDDGDGVEDWFNGSNDPTLADQINIWVGDQTIGAQGYESYFRLYLGLPGVYDHWTDQGNSALATEENTPLFEACRSAFVKSIDGHDKSDPDDVWVWPSPWAP